VERYLRSGTLEAVLTLHEIFRAAVKSNAPLLPVIYTKEAHTIITIDLSRIIG